MKKISLLVIVLVLKSLHSLSAQIDNEANFYTPVAHANYNRNLVTDYGVDNDFATDDSVSLQTAIDDISTNGGGVLIIPAGNYTFTEINLKSNVHVDIDDDVVIRPNMRTDNTNYSMLRLGGKTDPIENVSITSSSGGRFTVDLTHNNNSNVSVFSCGKVTNFLLANCNIEDAYTKFNGVITGGSMYEGNFVNPVNGIVKDMNINNASYGYGMVQTQSAENILFKDLSGTGGATLRLETGFKGLNNLQGDNLPPGETRVGGLDNIVARNISSTNGNCALMISPHAVHNGTVDAEGIVSVNSGFAVRIESGFVDQKKYDLTINLDPGTFEHVRVKDVTATYGDTAELKSKHFKHYPPEISNPTTISSYASNIYIGPSIAPVLADANYSCTGNVQTVVIEAPVVSSGFLYQEDVIPLEFVNLNCASLSVNKVNEKDIFKLYPNPTSDTLFIEFLNEVEDVDIYNIAGILVQSISKKELKNKSLIDTKNIASGIYFLRTTINGNQITKKVVVE